MVEFNQILLFERVFMKKTRAFALLFALLLLLSFTLCSCEELAVPVAGSNGLSAYEIAVNNGFEGTEAEWLESLKGADGKDGVDGKDGIDGKDGVDGVDGADGKDAETPVFEQTINQDITENKIAITGDGVDVKYATSVALKSAVTVSSTFTDASSHSYGFAGSGVIYSLDFDGSAFIVTNYHVVYDSLSTTSNKISDQIYVFLYGLEYGDFKVSASFVGGSMLYDIALLRVEANDIFKSAYERGVLSATSFDEFPVLGETAIAIGNPEGEGFSATAGIINVLSEEIKMQSLKDTSSFDIRVMRTDTPINGGNSGGGLFNSDGALLGIVNAKIENETIDNIGYAIPSSLVHSLCENIINFCYKQANESVMRPYLKIQILLDDITTVYNSETGTIDIIEKNIVDTVVSGGPAHGLLKAGDAVKSVTIGEKTIVITRQFQFIEALLLVKPGEKFTILVEREGVSTPVEITLALSDFVAQE